MSNANKTPIEKSCSRPKDVPKGADVGSSPSTTKTTVVPPILDNFALEDVIHPKMAFAAFRSDPWPVVQECWTTVDGQKRCTIVERKGSHY